jgi:hypothetical protein
VSAGARKVLAWETACDNVDFANVFCGEFSHVSVAGHVRPVLCEDFAGELFDFTEGDGFKSTCSFEAKAKPSDAREKIEDAKLAHTPPPLSLTATSAHKAGRRS